MTDPEMRAFLHPWWLAQHPDSVLVNEYGGLSEARADVAAFSEAGNHAYEIKSDHDSLRRLPSQLEAYATLFHRVTIISGPRYQAKVAALAPDWMGLVLVDELGAITLVRAAGDNPTPPLTARALWIAEGQHLCRTHGLRGYSRLTSWTLPDFLHERLPAAVIEAWVLQCIRHRYPKPFGQPGVAAKELE